MVTQNVLRTCEGKRVLSEIDSKLATALALNKCLKQIKLPKLLLTCATISMLPSSISTIHRYYIQGHSTSIPGTLLMLMSEKNS